MADSEELAKLERRVDKRDARVKQALIEKGRLKWFLVLAVTTWPIGLIWNGWIAAWIFTGWLTFWGVGYYTNFFHLRRAREALAEAEKTLQAARDEA
jgi:hypothetical protein